MKAKKFDDTEKWAKEDDEEKDEKAREEGAFGFRLPFRVFQSQSAAFLFCLSKIANLTKFSMLMIIHQN